MSEININDIKKAYFSKTLPVKLELCYSGKSVNVRPLKVKDKKEFLKIVEKDNDELLNSFIDKLIERYVSSTDDDNPVNVSSLIDSERHQLMMSIRQQSTSEESALISHFCPSCKALNKNVSFKFKDIVTTNFKKPEDAEDFFESKNGNVKIKIGFLTRGDMVEVEKYFKAKNIETKVEKDYIFLASTVKEIYLSVDDIEKKYTPSISERVEFVEGLSLDDFEKIKNYFIKCGQFGASLQFNFACGKCAYVNEKEEAQIVDFFIN